MDKDTGGQRDIWAEQIDRQKDGQMDTETGGQRNIWADRQIERWADGQTDRWTDEQMDILTYGWMNR